MCCPFGSVNSLRYLVIIVDGAEAGGATAAVRVWKTKAIVRGMVAEGSLMQLADDVVAVHQQDGWVELTLHDH